MSLNDVNIDFVENVFSPVFFWIISSSIDQ